jgi:hypothetical protein
VGRTNARARLTTAAWAVPLLVGILYGFWSSEIERNAPGPSPITAGNVVLGVVSGLVVALIAFLLHRMPRRLPRELRSFAWGAFAGVSFGYLYSLTGTNLFRTFVVGILTCVGITVMMSYRYQTMEERSDLREITGADSTTS